MNLGGSDTGRRTRPLFFFCDSTQMGAYLLALQLVQKRTLLFRTHWYFGSPGGAAEPRLIPCGRPGGEHF